MLVTGMGVYPAKVFKFMEISANSLVLMNQITLFIKSSLNVKFVVLDLSSVMWYHLVVLPVILALDKITLTLVQQNVKHVLNTCGATTLLMVVLVV